MTTEEMQNALKEYIYDDDKRDFIEKVLWAGRVLSAYKVPHESIVEILSKVIGSCRGNYGD